MRDYIEIPASIESFDGINNEQLEAHANEFDTFIFDLDGTLLNTLPDLVLLTNTILDELGFPKHTSEEILSYVGNGVRKLMLLAMPENAQEEDCEKAMTLWNERFHEYYHNTIPYPGIVNTLTQLRERGCKIGVVSNKFQQGVDLILSICLPGLIDFMLGESPVVPRKPDPTGLEMTMRFLNSTPDKCVYIGDSPSDMLAAHNAHMFAVAVTWGYHKPPDFAEDGCDPDVFIDSPEALLKIAKR